ncbi:MAG: ATP-binding protein, partial [Ghiorsea sp.]|nr:ATP-binding protein [Ghiorsea sp.]
MIFIDEMGKFLEKASSESTVDVYFFQQLAELANRSKGKIVLVGILHQSFSEYSRSLPKSSRDEWIKIQGRFVDLAINAAGEEQIELISRAITSDEKPQDTSHAAHEIAKIITKNRPASLKSLGRSLNRCWPLHPIVAALLGPVSRKRFGQNQRSIFSFLSSAEPFGFQNFLTATNFSSELCYTPAQYWDYLQANLESAIVASSSSKMWAVAADALNKCAVNNEHKYTINVLKTICVIDLFKGTSGLSVTLSTLESVFPNHNIEDSLKQLQSLSLIRFNKYSGSYSLYEGSDFDIEEAVGEAYKHITDLDFRKLHEIASFLPVVAKRHHHSTGALRWMDIKLTPISSINPKTDGYNEHAFGTFSMVIPKNKVEYNNAIKSITNIKQLHNSKPTIYAIASEFKKLFEFSKELLALEWLQKNSSELSGDRIARKEVENRCSLIASLLGQALEQAVHSEIWFKDSVELGKLTGLQMSYLCSDLADNIFNASPALGTEILNRNKPSASANGALNALLKRMVLNKGEEKLGIEGYPAEGSLFKILLEDTGLYSKMNNKWQFTLPSKDPSQLSKLWALTDELLISYKKNFSLKTLYSEWSQPPF